MTRALEPIAKRAAEISAQLKDGDAARRDQLTRINGSIGDYQTTFSNTELDRPERRRRLARIDAQIKQGASLLKEAMPVALLSQLRRRARKGPHHRRAAHSNAERQCAPAPSRARGLGGARGNRQQNDSRTRPFPPKPE